MPAAVMRRRPDSAIGALKAIVEDCQAEGFSSAGATIPASWPAQAAANRPLGDQTLFGGFVACRKWRETHQLIGFGRRSCLWD